MRCPPARPGHGSSCRARTPRAGNRRYSSVRTWQHWFNAVLLKSIAHSWHVEFQSIALRGEIEFQVAVFFGVRRQFVRPARDLAPLEALADIPDRLLAGTPGGKMVELTIDLGQPLPAHPLERAATRQVTVGTTEVELSDLAQAQFLA